mgnify:CR=1 FL=1
MRPAVVALAAGLAAGLFAGCTADGPRNSAGQVTAPAAVDSYSIVVGDCVAKLETDSTRLLQLLPCTAEHQWEAFHAGTLEGEDFPGAGGVQSQAEALCTEAVEPFLGLSAKKSKYELRFLTPSKESWAQSDRAVVCLIGAPSGGITGTLKGAAK